MVEYGEQAMGLYRTYQQAPGVTPSRDGRFWGDDLFLEPATKLGF